MPTFQELLLVTDDLDLCCGVDTLLRERFRANLDAMPLAAQIVVWTLSADGIVGNGGFQYLFERWSDPDAYAHALHGFTTIGADESAEALAEVLTLFQGGLPPADRNRRLRRWRRFGWGWDHPTVYLFWQGSKKVPRLLAAYIRENQSSFEQMLAPP